MRILHYFLGFPPYRTGGLTKFAVDLMEAQQVMGHEVYALWPGRMNAFCKKLNIKSKGLKNNVKSYEIVNPLPVPLDKGMANPLTLTGDGEQPVYNDFFEEIKPDVIHIHTLMGLHEAFFICAKKKGIKIIFTTHDYYGICFKAYLYKGGCCSCLEDLSKCAECNLDGLSTKKIFLLQSGLYRVLKNSKLVSYMRGIYRKKTQRKNDIAIEGDCIKHGIDERLVSDYGTLREFYKKLFAYIDEFHFNSTVTEQIYRKFMPDINGKVISITHSNIKDNRKLRDFNNDKIRYTMLAPAKKHKGYNLLKETMDMMWNEGNHNFVLNLFGEVANKNEYMNIHEGSYEYKDLKDIFDKSDVVILPSVWYETFGFTALEALSFGVPVVVTDRVGAKDIVGDNFGATVLDVSVKGMYDILSNIDAEKLALWNKNIISDFVVKTMKDFAEEIEKMYVNN